MRSNLRGVTSFVATLLIALSFQNSTAIAASPKGAGYRKSDIADARFGTGERERLLQIAYTLRGRINEQVYGQEAAAAVLEAKMIQYLEGYPNRTGEPVMMNMIGLPGIGKSAMLELIKRLGFPVLEFDAQTYSGQDAPRLDDHLRDALSRRGTTDDGERNKPAIVLIEEIDKLVEKNSSTGAETTSGAIGILNMISSEGKIPAHYGGSVSVSNVMFLTTMNLSPVEFQAFSKEVLGAEKSYYDYTIEDFAKFDDWIRNQPSARYKVLAKMFRSNTVSRFGANTTIMQPLAEDSYKKIIDLQVIRAVRQNAQGQNAAKRVTVEVHPSMTEFLLKEAVFAPSGARETVARSNAIIEQLIGFGMKATGPGVQSVDRPRHIEVRYSPETGGVYVRVTEFILKKNSATEVRPGGAIAFRVRYDAGSRLFDAPESIEAVKPSYPKPTQAEIAERPVTKKEIFESRFPKSQERTKGLREKLATHLYGQTEAIDLLVTDLERYYGRQGPAKKEPSSRAIAGFPGIGKSELFYRAAEELNLPIARINMQKYASDSAETVEKFLAALNGAISMAAHEAKEKNGDGRYLLLFEEFDKVYEISPDGKLVNRPIIAVIKDLLNDGIIANQWGQAGKSVREAFVGLTMNFAVDRFGFEADPRLTSIDDVINAWKKLKMSPSAVKQVLGSMFLPDTVSRLMTQLSIMKPLDRPAYTKIIENQAEKVRATRLLDENGRNIGQIELKTTPRYDRYLFSEAVIPSEGARNTTKSADAMLTTDLEYALARLPKNSKFAKEPLTITFDFNERKSVVVFEVVLTNSPEEPGLKLENRTVALKFPSTILRGRISEDRMAVAAHEFGHAFSGARLGARFEHVVTVPTPDAGGYVKPNDRGSAAGDQISRLYMILGSRAFERMIFSENPMDAESVLRITSGPSQDIKQATMTLYFMLYELGLNPNGGTLDRNFVMGPGKYASYQDLPSDLAEKLGFILRDLENEVLRETLAEHTRDWYVDKIAKLARAGSMNEKEFYKLIGRKLPSSDRRSVGTRNAYFREMFGKYLVRPTNANLKAAAAKAGDSNMSASENVERAIENFSRIVSNRLGRDTAAAVPVVRSCSVLFQSAR